MTEGLCEAGLFRGGVEMAGAEGEHVSEIMFSLIFGEGVDS